jgi:hypothetical protein
MFNKMSICDNKQILNSKKKYINNKLQNCTDDKKLEKLIDIIDDTSSANTYASKWNNTHTNINNIKKTAYTAAGLANVAFATAIIIATIVTILFIPIVYNTITADVKNIWYKLLIIWLLLIAIIFIVEMCVCKFNSQ